MSFYTLTQNRRKITKFGGKVEIEIERERGEGSQVKVGAHRSDYFLVGADYNLRDL